MDNWKNQLFFGDNLEILQSGRIPIESVDLIYLDPPFNSSATYNVLFAEKTGERSAAQITAFEDTWHWGQEAAGAYDDVNKHGPRKLADLLQALRAFLGGNDMMAYLAMMAVRLVELHRVLKPTGSIYLHCDPTASHYLKLLLDAIFDVRNFRNEIVWCYKLGGRPRKGWPKKHDIILFYSKGKEDNFVFNSDAVRVPYESTGGYISSGRKLVKDKEYKVHPLGKVPEDWWFISALNRASKERLGYPTQKPEALLERIIKASSNEGDLVLDPFCGCGTTVTVAERLKRRWLGIDLTHLAITLIKERLRNTFKEDRAPYEVIGEPADVTSAAALAEVNRHQFEWWALGLVNATPAQDKKKGADRGVDGVIYFKDDASGQYKKIIVQVKSGGVNAALVRELEGTRGSEKAEIAVLLTLKPSTRPMREAAAAADFYAPPDFPDRRFPRLQILTIAELLAGQKLDYPRWAVDETFKKAPRRYKETDLKQNDLL